MNPFPKDLLKHRKPRHTHRVQSKGDCVGCSPCPAAHVSCQGPDGSPLTGAQLPAPTPWPGPSQLGPSQLTPKVPGPFAGLGLYPGPGAWPPLAGPAANLGGGLLPHPPILRCTGGTTLPSSPAHRSRGGLGPPSPCQGFRTYTHTQRALSGLSHLKKYFCLKKI